MGMCLPVPNAGATGDRFVRVMRWTFRREDEAVVCELGLNRDNSAYELRIDPPGNPTGISSETFRDAAAAFERHGAVERCLLENGWSLERFESGQAAR